MFAGSYLDENDSQNLDHSVINLFSDDEGDNYIYINPSGIISPIYNNKVEYVFLTKQYDKGCQEILGIAKVKSQLTTKPTRKGDSAIAQQSARYNRHIKYGQQSLTKIFKNNMHNGNKDEYFKHPVLTFQTQNFYFPKERIFLAEHDSPIQEDKATIRRLPENYHFGRHSLRLYFSNTDDTIKQEVFQVLDSIIKEQNLLEEGKPPTIHENDIEKYGKEITSYLEIMGRINSENIYSNLLCYFLKIDSTLLKHFCKKICNVNNISKNATIEREKHRRTDIWIEDNNHIIVIENKIEAGLSRPDQLKEYAKAAKKKKHVTLRLIAPNSYSKINLDENECCDGFKMKRYGEIYEVLKSHTIHIPGEDESYIEKLNLYYSDFLRALSIHGKPEKSASQASAEQLLYKRLYLLSKKQQ